MVAQVVESHGDWNHWIDGIICVLRRRRGLMHIVIWINEGMISLQSAMQKIGGLPGIVWN